MARLLWRGSLYPADSSSSSESHPLHGLAIVASSFSLLSVKSHDPEDPFSSSASSPNKADSNAELCLDLEMLRNRGLRVLRQVRISSGDASVASASITTTTKIHGRRALKKSIEMLRKGKQREHRDDEERGLVYLEEDDNEQDADNLSLYIDERANDTVGYFNEIFCKEHVDPETGKTRIGLLLSLGGEQRPKSNSLFAVTSAPEDTAEDAKSTVVVYGRLKMQEKTSRPVLQLHVARQRSKRKELGPRPDDPAPRENLFAQKLRRTVSQPALSFPTSLPSSSSSLPSTLPLSFAKANSKRPSLSTIQTAPPTGSGTKASSAKVGTGDSVSASSHAQNATRILHRSKSSSLALPNSGASAGASKARNPFQASFSSSSSLGSKSEDGKVGMKRSMMDERVKNIHASPGRRGSKRPRLTAGGLKALQEEELEDGPDCAQENVKAEQDNVMGFETNDVGHHEEDEDEDGGDLLLSMNKRERDHSPTPSMASAKSYTTAFSMSTSVALATSGTTKAGAGKTTMARSMSMPPGQLGMGMGNGAGGFARQKQREASIAGAEGGDGGGVTSIETRNKGTIRKVLLSEMVLRNYTREHPDFTEVFSVSYKGIQCAFRRSIGKDKMDKEALQEIVRRHLEMYIPPR